MLWEWLEEEPPPSFKRSSAGLKPSLCNPCLRGGVAEIAKLLKLVEGSKTSYSS